ncbi:unnamed protein product [Euphydryas editha]|uniref:Uncharacterized protein n=1 Tax=Euphydryas editha TaxID=104508 RepID=A0AAU9V3U8_EUPED|nr:unnamed protein product [Euphydryas editha]
MASSDPEIKDGVTLPVWPKSKLTKELEPFASSLQAPEDSFFYIRYPKTDLLVGKTKFNNELPKVSIEQNNEVAASATYNVAQDKYWSKHTKQCQEVQGIASINTAVNSKNAKPKSMGIDDGFKVEGAACDSSVVKVASQMDQTPSEAGSPEPQPQARHPARRGSKSLPTTPVHSPPASPAARRRVNGNRYFTSPFAPIEDANNRSWLTMALLGFKKDLATSTSTLAEEETVENRLHGSSLAESVESLGPAPKVNPKVISNNPSSQQPELTKPANSFRSKPTEFREINIWSPTSM